MLNWTFNRYFPILDILPKNKLNKISFPWLYLIFLAILLSGCTGLGAKTLPTDRNSYNIAIQKSNDEELLLNLVRLQYRDNPLFLEVTNVSANSTYTASAKTSATLQKGVSDIFNLGGGAAVTANPTINYSPLQGEKFFKMFLKPVSLNTVLLLYNSGWKIDRILNMCFQRFGDLPNAPRASTPTPNLSPNFRKFQRFAELIWIMRVTGALKILQVQIPAEGEKENKKDKKHYSFLLVDFDDKKASKWPKEFSELKKLIGLSEAENSFFLGSQWFPHEKKFISHGSLGKEERTRYINVETRPLVSIMYFLSHAVEVPDEDKASEGRKDGNKVAITRYAMNDNNLSELLNPTGKQFDWGDLMDNILKIKFNPTKPGNAAIAINYRGHWFYIEDADLVSKSTFSMLSQIFALQKTSIESQTPILTIPVGGR